MIAQEEDYPFTYGFGVFDLTVLPEVQRDVNKDILISFTDEMSGEYDPATPFRNAVNAFLIETQENTILVDAGYGRKLFGHLETCGKEPEDIDVILLTHMHGDHIGGLLREEKKAFPNAELYVSQPEYDFWMSDEQRGSLPENRRGGFDNARKVLTVYKDQLHLFVPGEAGDPGQELLPGIRPIAAYGHTPGHTAYLLNSDDYQFLIWGDLTHVTSVQISYPQVAVTYDVDPVKAVEYRRQLLEYISNNGIRVAGMHIEYPGMLDLKGNASKGYGFTLLCTCEGKLR